MIKNYDVVEGVDGRIVSYRTVERAGSAETAAMPN